MEDKEDHETNEIKLSIFNILYYNYKIAMTLNCKELFLKTDFHS